MVQKLDAMVNMIMQIADDRFFFLGLFCSSDYSALMVDDDAQSVSRMIHSIHSIQIYSTSAFFYFFKMRQRNIIIQPLSNFKHTIPTFKHHITYILTLKVQEAVQSATKKEV
jgi:hypothetical protein